MRFDIITIFPDIFSSYLNESILKRAQKKRLIKIKAHDLRKFARDKHKTVDDKPYGGGPGMILKVEPLYRAVRQISNFKFKISNEKKIKKRIILFSAKGKTMTQQDVRQWAKYSQLILICGRYEGVDERVAKYIADEEVSVGNYVLTGGEIPAMIVVDAVSRLVAGVLGKKESLVEESFSLVNRKQKTVNSENNYLEYPQYTRPEDFMDWKAPEVLLSGDHEKIRTWREKTSGNK